MEDLANVVGAKIVDVRPLTDAELANEGWDKYEAPTCALVLDNGTVLYPARDPEGNGGGAMFGTDAESNFQLHVREVPA